MPQQSRLDRRLAIKHVESLADDQYGVVARQQIRDAGLNRWDVRNQIAAGRWQLVGKLTVAVHQGELSTKATWRMATFEAGPQAALDGVTALQAAGLTGFDAPTCVSLPYGWSPIATPADVDVRITRWRAPDDVIHGAVPRVRPAIAAVRGALWAISDRQAAFILVLAVQQRLTTSTALESALARVKRHGRRHLVATVILDIADGVRAMGELDFAAHCRSRGLPEPSRQVVRRGRNGRVYLDVYWDEYRLVVEIEGIHHNLGVTPVDDALRQNELTIESDAVLRVPVLGLRLEPDAFMEQVAQALRRRGA